MLRKGLILVSILLLAVSTLFAAGGAESRDGSADTFYTSRDTLEVIVSWSAGGGTDTIARLMAPYLSKHIEGEPGVQIINVAGGGGIQGHNEFALRRRPDGTNMLFSAGSSQIAYLLNEPGIRFDFRDMQPAFGVPAGAVIYSNPQAGVSSVDDLLNPSEPIRFGSIGVASTDAIVLLAFDVLGLDVQTIFGYEGSGAIRVAFEQGEVNINRDGTIGYLGNVLPLVEDGLAVPLFTFGQVRDGQVVRDPAFPDIPTIAEVHERLHGVPPSGDTWEMFKAISSALFTLEKVMWFQKDAPAEAVQAVKDAGVKISADPEFRSHAQSIFGPYELIVGDEIESAVHDMLSALSVEVRNEFIQFLVDNYGLSPRSAEAQQ